MTERSLQQQFADSMGQLLGPDFPSDIALAVSGGGDSMAMLYLAHNWTRDWGVRLHVVTVDHGLRPESADEAAMVARECDDLGWPHKTLRWQWDGRGNKMDAARRGRLSLIDGWRGNMRHVLFAHTEDDVAETFLMRLRRGAGLDGLAAMKASRFVASDVSSGALPDRASGPAERGFDVIRPCLGMSRADLRHYLTTLHGPWVEDPSNDDPAYDRARLRRVLQVLKAEGIDQAALAGTANRLQEERVGARTHAASVWSHNVGEQHSVRDGWWSGVLVLKPDWHRFADKATQRRILSAALRWVSCSEYAPRADALERFHDRLLSGGTGTLHGCDVCVHKGKTYVFRELAAVEGPKRVDQPDTTWDGRWVVTGQAFDGMTVRALGEEGWQQVKDKPGDALPHRVALSLPSLWQGDRLLACDALGVGPGDATQLRPRGMTQAYFHRFLLSH